MGYSHLPAAFIAFWLGFGPALADDAVPIANEKPETFEQMDGRPPPEPVAPIGLRTLGLPAPSPAETGFQDRNWVYAQFGATGAIALNAERECRVDSNTTVHGCMRAAGYGRARLNTTQITQLGKIREGDARIRFLLNVVDEAGRDPGLYIFVEEDPDSGPAR